MKRSTSIGLVAAAALATWIATCGSEGDDVDAASLLEDRLWVDRLPDRKEDEIHVAMFVRGGEDAGDFDGTSALAKGNSFRGDFERYRWKSAGAKKLEVEPLPRGRASKVTYEATTCREDGFHYCLTIEGLPRGPQKYRSKRGWEIDPGGADLEATLGAMRRALTP